MRAVILILLVLLLYSPPAMPQAARLEVVVDPRIELLSAAMSQSDWIRTHPTWLSTYAREMQQMAFPQRRHPVVQRLNALHKTLTGQELMAWALCYSPPPALDPRAPLPADVLEALGGQAGADNLAAALRSFAQEARFADFAANHRGFYDTLVAAYRKHLPEDGAAERVAGYYGVRRGVFTIVLSPLFTRFRFAQTFQEPDGERRCRVMDQPQAVEDGLPVFEAERVREMPLLGIGGALAGEAIRAVPLERRNRHADWFAYVDYKLRKAGIGNWETALVDSGARAGAVRVLLAQGDREAAARLLRQSLEAGFAWLPFMVDRLKEYEAARDQYPSFREFVPRLLEALDELEPTFTQGEPQDLGLADVGLTGDGVPVYRVAPGSPAARAGIRANDLVTAIAGIRITGSESYLKAWHRWEASQDGERVPFAVQRGGKRLTLTVVMRRAKTFEGFRKKETGTP